ncbi:MAG: hypothetical protein FJ011_09510 [Chloroflexi bacterium]|nr:hypothetical protein [Chloroflexota bacterium]
MKRKMSHLSGRDASAAGKSDGELTPAEHAELLQFVAQVESADAERAQALIALARLRDKPVAMILHECSPEYVVNAA